jgi:hypothetical protein
VRLTTTGSTVSPVRATAWHNGRASEKPAGYGIKFTPADRDRHFHPAWGSAVLEMEGFGSTVIELSGSFRRNNC